MDTFNPSDFVGEAADLPLGLPTKRQVLKFIAFTRNNLVTAHHGAKYLANTMVFKAVADRLFQLYTGYGFQTVTRHTLVR